MFEHDFPPSLRRVSGQFFWRVSIVWYSFWYSKKWCFPQQNIHHEEFLPQELPVPLVVRLAIRVHHPPGSSLAILTPAVPNPRCSVEKNPVDLDFLLPTWTQQPWGVNIRSTLIYSSYFKVFFPLTSYQRKHLDHFMFPKCRIFVAPCFAVQREDSCFVANHPGLQRSNRPWPRAVKNDPTRIIVQWMFAMVASEALGFRV